jgi:hypothetical protein
MRLMLVRLLVLGLFVLQGLALAQDGELKLELGTPRADVIKALGEPVGKIKDGNNETLLYSDGREILLEDGQVTMITGSEGLVIKRAEGSVGTTVSRSAPSPASSPSTPAIEMGGYTVDENTASEFLQFQTDGMEMIPTWAPLAGMVFLVMTTFFMLATMWRLFEKAGYSGWASLVPIYNAYVMLEIAGKPGWWLFLMIIPFVNFIVAIMVPFGVAEMFGKSWGFGLGLLLLPWLFYPILAFGSTEYLGVAV